MFVSKKKHDLVVEDYERRIAALELDNVELLRQGNDLSIAVLKSALGRMVAEDAVVTALRAAEVAIRRVEAEKDAADAALARYLADYAPRALEPVS